MTSCYELETIEAEGIGSKKFSFQSDITIGRGKDADVYIDLKSLSRKHARIQIDENNQCKLINLSTTNPTVVNGNIVHDELILSHNDMLNIGMRHFYFRRAENPTATIENQNIPNKSDEKNQIDGKKPSFLVQLTQCFATRGVLPDAAKAEKFTSNLQNKVSAVKGKGAALMPTPLKDAIHSRRKSIGNKRPLTEIIAKPSAVKVNNALKPPTNNSQNQGDTSSLKLRTAFASNLQAALQARGVGTAGRTPQKIGVNSSLQHPSTAAAPSQIPSTPQGNQPIVQHGQTSKPMVAIRKVLSTPQREGIQRGLKGSVENNVEVTTKADIERPSKGFSYSMRKAIHARRSSYRPTPVKTSVVADRLASPEKEVAIKDAEILSSCPPVASVDVDALTAANTRSNKRLQSLSVPTLLATEEIAVSSETTPQHSARKMQTVANSVSKNTTHISWCSTTPTSTVPPSAAKTAIAPQRLSNISISVDGENDNDRLVYSGVKEVDTTVPSSVDTTEVITSTDNSTVESRVQILETSTDASTINIEVHDSTVEIALAPSVQKAMTTRLKKLKSSESATDLRRKKSKSPLYKYAFKPSTKKGYCDKVVAIIGKSNRLFGGMSLKLPKKKLRQTWKAPMPESCSSNDLSFTMDTFYPSTMDLHHDGQVAEGDYIQNMLLSKPILAEDAVQALAIEICAHSYANELTKEGISDDTAFETAMDSVTADAVVFSRRNSLRSGTPIRETPEHSASNSRSAAPTPTQRNKESVIQSLQKKAIAPSSAAAESDIMSLLTDAELKLLDVYAEKLSLYGLSDEEAYAIALDAYIAGIERYFSTLESAIQYRTQLVSDMEETGPTGPTEDVTPQSDNEISFEHPISAQKDFFADMDEVSASEDAYSLRDFFQLPPVYLDANDDSLDTELVENYAQELQQVAYVDAAIAYGIALDSFLADPVTFRHRIGKLPLPRALPIAFTHSESDKDEQVDANESADYERNDHLSISTDRFVKVHSVAEQEKLPSNRHIYFSIDEEDEVASRNPFVESVEKSLEKYSVVGEATDADIAESGRNAEQCIGNIDKTTSNILDCLEPADTIAVVETVKTAESEIQVVENIAEPQYDMSNALGSSKEAHPVVNLEQIPSNNWGKSISSVLEEKPSSNTRKRGVKKSDPETVVAEATSVRTTRKRVANEAVSVASSTATTLIAVAPRTEIDDKKVCYSTLTNAVEEGSGLQPKKQTRRVKLGSETDSSTLHSEENKAQKQEAAADDTKKSAPMKQRSCSRRRGEACRDGTTAQTTSTSLVSANTANAVAATSTSVPTVPFTSGASRVTRKRVAETSVGDAVKTSTSKKVRASSRGKAATAAVEEEEEEDTEEALVIICDKCDMEFFVDEVGISDIPEGDWFCVSCVRATLTTAAAKAARSKSVVRQRQQPLAASPTEQQQPSRMTRSGKRV